MLPPTKKPPGSERVSRGHTRLRVQAVFYPRPRAASPWLTRAGRTTAGGAKEWLDS